MLYIIIKIEATLRCVKGAEEINSSPLLFLVPPCWLSRPVCAHQFYRNAYWADFLVSCSTPTMSAYPPSSLGNCSLGGRTLVGLTRPTQAWACVCPLAVRADVRGGLLGACWERFPTLLKRGTRTTVLWLLCLGLMWRCCSYIKPTNEPAWGLTSLLGTAEQKDGKNWHQ